MKNIRQSVLMQGGKDGVDMVRHRTRCHECVTLAFEIAHRVVDHFAHFGPCQVASAVPRVERLIKTPINIVKPRPLCFRKIAPHLLSGLHNILALELELTLKSLRKRIAKPESYGVGCTFHFPMWKVSSATQGNGIIAERRKRNAGILPAHRMIRNAGMLPACRTIRNASILLHFNHASHGQLAGKQLGLGRFLELVGGDQISIRKPHAPFCKIHDEVSSANIGFLVFHLPRVKSGQSTIPWSVMDFSESGLMTLSTTES